MLRRLYHRFFDRTLRRAATLPDRTEIGPGAWNQLIGKTGEDLAARYLSAAGYRILRRNFRAPGGGEVDLVTARGQTLAFTEVKTRTKRPRDSSYGRAALAVTSGKQTLIAKGGVHWLRLLRKKDTPFRFDIVEVILIDGELPEITHLQDAFGMPDSVKR